MERVLWRPSEERAQSSAMARFRTAIEKKYGLNFKDYPEFHRWSVEHSETFWSELISFGGLIYEGTPRPAVLDKTFDSYAWFPELKLSLAENLLVPRASEALCLDFLHESGLRQTLNYEQLCDQVSKVQAQLRKWGVGPGDVVAAYMPNCLETVVVMLACGSIGGVFTSTSSDFGVEGVVDRFGQSRPKVLMAALEYTYNGKTFDNRTKVSKIIDALTQEIGDAPKLISVNFLGDDRFEGGVSYKDILKQESAGPLKFTRLPFSSPSYIMYSSGTTGRPKCIVHTIGGVILQHYKELVLHTDLKEGERLLYFTTCGWMMWNWLVSGLMAKATVVLFEGSPSVNGLTSFVNSLNDWDIDIFGTSPKFLKALEDENGEISPLRRLKTILSTGAPLLPEQFDYVYESLKSDVQLASISGGTDILGCFMLGHPELPVYRGEIQCLGLGMDVSSFDKNGIPCFDQEGELVCRQSFPSRPIGFLNDENNQLFKEAYFSGFKGVWTHGDFITMTKRESVVVFGRSDATLNPGGVRIGTAEIYRQTERIAYLEDALCVGRPVDGDVDVVLFVKMRPGESLSDQRIQEIKQVIRQKTTPRHVPKEIREVSGIPYTRSGKKMELAVTRILSGRPLTNREAVANPECLEDYS